jgi:hypothetical protein
MTRQSWSSAPYTIHVNGDPSAVAAAAAAAGALVIHWSVAGIRNQRELDASAAEIFEFPFPSASAAGLIDMLSDLEWLDVDNGVLLLIDAADTRDEVVEIVAGILPGIADRWRSSTMEFEVFLIGVTDGAHVESVLERENERLDAAGRVEWSRHDIARVPVVIHSPAAEA